MGPEYSGFLIITPPHYLLFHHHTPVMTIANAGKMRETAHRGNHGSRKAPHGAFAVGGRWFVSASSSSSATTTHP